MKAVALVASEGSARASEARRALRLDPRTKVLMLVCANVTLLCSGFDAAGFVLKCLEDGAEACPRRDRCVAINFWRGLDQAIEDYVDNVTLADLVQMG